jgi:hypothetical protein
MKKWLPLLLISAGSICAPRLALSNEALEELAKRYPKATFEVLHENAENKEWIYQATSQSGDVFITAYSRAKSRSGYYPILLNVTTEGKIISVELPDYPHKFGAKAATLDFLKQYLKLMPSDSVQYGSNIHGVTGATSTAQTTAVKVGELLALIKTKSES